MTTTEAPPVPYINLPLDTWTAFHSWVLEERKNLWYEFVDAARMAVRRPDPKDPEHWSIGMLHVADRIRETDKLLGGVVEWREVQWNAFPFFEAVSGEPLCEEAWQWLHDFVNAPSPAFRDKSSIEAAQRVLVHRPA